MSEILRKMPLVLLGTALNLYGAVFISAAADFNYNCSGCHENTKSVLTEKHPDVGQGECFFCHTEGKNAVRLGKIIHGKHITDMGISEETCLACHKLSADNTITVNNTENITVDKSDIADVAEKFVTFYEPGKLANSHKNAGEYCLSCHKTFDIDESENMSSKCISCHGSYEEMVKKTESSAFIRNPHKHHYQSLDCTKCHIVHDDFTDYCLKCHQWNFTWQQKIKK